MNNKLYKRFMIRNQVEIVYFYVIMFYKYFERE